MICLFSPSEDVSLVSPAPLLSDCFHLGAFDCLFVTGILGILMYAVCTYIENRTTGWSMRGVQGVSFSN